MYYGNEVSKTLYPILENPKQYFYNSKSKALISLRKHELYVKELKDETEKEKELTRMALEKIKIQTIELIILKELTKITLKKNGNTDN